MANTSRSRGFRPYRQLLRVTPYNAESALYPGDVLKFGPGTSSTSIKLAGVVAGTAAAASCGIALSYASAAGKEILVADHPDQLFVCLADATSVIDNNLDIGMNVDFVATAANTTYKVSNHVIDSSTIATTATLPFKVLGIFRRVDNEYGTGVDVVVKINNHQLGSHTGTAGIDT